nr:proline-rich receptor-like protein kinase PERK9 [Lolium perenne]
MTDIEELYIDNGSSSMDDMVNAQTGPHATHRVATGHLRPAPPPLASAQEPPPRRRTCLDPAPPPHLGRPRSLLNFHARSKPSPAGPTPPHRSKPLALPLASLAPPAPPASAQAPSTRAPASLRFRSPPRASTFPR